MEVPKRALKTEITMSERELRWGHAYSICRTQLQANCGGWNVGQSEEKGKETRSESWHGWRQIAQAFQAVEDIVFFSQWDGKLLGCFKQRSEMTSHKFERNCFDPCTVNHQLRSRWPVRNVLMIFQAENKDSLDQVFMTEVVKNGWLSMRFWGTSIEFAGVLDIEKTKNIAFKYVWY